MTYSITLTHCPQSDAFFRKAARTVKGRLLQGRPVVVTLEEEKRSTGQNRLMWAILDAFSSQKSWTVNGTSCSLDRDDWKDLLTCAFSKEAGRIAPGLDGGVVMLGARTSKWDKARMSEFIDWLQATAAQMGVTYE